MACAAAAVNKAENPAAGALRRILLDELPNGERAAAAAHPTSRQGDNGDGDHS